MRRNAIFVLTVCICIAVIAAVVSAAETTAPPKPVASIPMLDGGVTVDGNITEPMWSKALVVAIPRRYDEKVPSSANDVTGEGRLFWNSEGLHLSIKVTDKKLNLVKPGEDMTEYDSVEFWLDKLWLVAALPTNGGAQFTTVNHNDWHPAPAGSVKVMV